MYKIIYFNLALILLPNFCHGQSGCHALFGFQQSGTTLTVNFGFDNQVYADNFMVLGFAAPPPPRPEELKGRPDGFSGVQSVRSQGTRVRSVERQDFNRVVIIVDGQKAGGYPVDAIADYIAMVTVAQIDPSAQTHDYPTILNLFADDPDVVSFQLTNWDLAYLDGLYRTTPNAASVHNKSAISADAWPVTAAVRPFGGANPCFVGKPWLTLRWRS